MKPNKLPQVVTVPTRKSYRILVYTTCILDRVPGSTIWRHTLCGNCTHVRCARDGFLIYHPIARIKKTHIDQTFNISFQSKTESKYQYPNKVLKSQQKGVAQKKPHQIYVSEEKPQPSLNHLQQKSVAYIKKKTEHQTKYIKINRNYNDKLTIIMSKSYFEKFFQ